MVVRGSGGTGSAELSCAEPRRRTDDNTQPSQYLHSVNVPRTGFVGAPATVSRRRSSACRGGWGGWSRSLRGEALRHPQRGDIFPAILPMSVCMVTSRKSQGKCHWHAGDTSCNFRRTAVGRLTMQEVQGGRRRPSDQDDGAYELSNSRQQAELSEQRGPLGRASRHNDPEKLIGRLRPCSAAQQPERRLSPSQGLDEQSATSRRRRRGLRIRSRRLR